MLGLSFICFEGNGLQTFSTSSCTRTVTGTLIAGRQSGLRQIKLFQAHPHLQLSDPKLAAVVLLELLTGFKLCCLGDCPVSCGRANAACFWATAGYQAACIMMFLS